MMNPFKKFTELFKKKEEEDEIPEEWKNPDQVESLEIPKILEETENPSKVNRLRNLVPHFPTPQKKIAIPGLTKVKKTLAFVLMILNVIVGLLDPNPVTLIFYILTALLLLDYLFKTRYKEETKPYYALYKMEEE